MIKNAKIAKSSWVAHSADVIGNVEVGEECGIWYNATVRADLNKVTIKDLAEKPGVSKTAVSFAFNTGYGNKLLFILIQSHLYSIIIMNVSFSFYNIILTHF